MTLVSQTLTLTQPQIGSTPKGKERRSKREEGEEGKGLISPISNQNREKNQIGFNRTLTLTRDEEGEERDSIQIEKKRNQMKEMNRIERIESGKETLTLDLQIG